MELIDLFLKKSPQWTTKEAKEAEWALLRYFELLYEANKRGKNENK